MPIAVTGITGLLLIELMIGRLPRSAMALAQPLWWGIVSLSLIPRLGPAPAALCETAGFLALLELEGTEERAALPMILSATGLVICVLDLWSEPWWAFATTIALALWALVRRMRPYATPLAATALDLAAAVLPLASVVAFGLATHDAPLTVLVGSSLVLASTVPATRPGTNTLARRDPHDHFWMRWWNAGMLTAVVAAGVVVTTYWPTP